MKCNEFKTCATVESCDKSCDDARAECGEVCGNACGDCDSDEVCEAGICMCEPRCDGETCNDNGCGGNCECPKGTYCNGAMVCTKPEDCLDSCSSLEWECGTVCGDDCGACGEGRQCLDGHCEGVTSCDTCPLRLVYSNIITSDNTKTIEIDLTYTPMENGAFARIFELYVVTDPPLEMKRVTEGEAITDSDKKISVNAETGNAWYETRIGRYRVSAMSLSNTNALSQGVLARLELEAPPRMVNTEARLWIERRQQIFAPEEADVMLQISPYDDVLSLLIK